MVFNVFYQQALLLMGVIVVKPEFLLVFNHLETVRYIQHCELGIYS